MHGRATRESETAFFVLIQNSMEFYEFCDEGPGRIGKVLMSSF